MPDELPPSVLVVTTPRGELYELPSRDVGCLRIVAIPVVLVGLLFCAVGLYVSLIEGGLLGVITGGRMGGGKPLDLFNAVFGVPFFLSGFVPLYTGAFLYAGRSTIELRDDSLIATQRSGPFRWRRKIGIADIRKFQVKSANMDEKQLAIGSALSALNVSLAGGRLRNLAWGYPKNDLRALADHLASRCKAPARAKLIHDDQQAIEVEERILGQEKFESDVPEVNEDGVPPRPTDSTVIYEPHEDGLTITVPPVGMRKASKGMLGFAIFWNGFMAVVTTGWLFAGKGSDAVIVYIVFPLFWLVGIAMALGAVNAGRRRAILDVVGDTLLITRKTLFKTTQQEVHRDNIKSIRRDKSGVEVNDVPVLNLQVRLHQGKKISMLSQLSNNELSWIAALLREALRVPGK